MILTKFSSINVSFCQLHFRSKFFTYTKDNKFICFADVLLMQVYLLVKAGVLLVKKRGEFCLLCYQLTRNYY